MTGDEREPEREALIGLRARHLAFLERRLSGDEAAAAWRTSVVAGLEAVLTAPVADVLPPDVIADALERALSGAAFDAVARPAAAAIQRAILAELSAEKGSLGDAVPKSAREALERLAAKKGLVPERVIREVCAQEAAREVMGEVLSDALRDFQAKVNPFSAEWGLPALLKKLSPFGLGMGKGLDGLRGEFERRLEPEMKRFLQGASRHALERMADMLVTKWDEPRFVALRKELVRWALAQPKRDLARAAPADVYAEAQGVALDVARALLVDPAERTRRRNLVRAFVATHGSRDVASALRSLGMDPAIDAGALADASWPALRAALASPAARAWFTSLVADFYDEELERAAASKPAAG